MATLGLLACRPSLQAVWNLSMTAKEVVQNFWDAMQTNDFAQAGKWLSEDYELTWPMSGERIIGRDDFVAVNSYYPANGRWEFTVHSLLVEGDVVVSDVGVTDGVVRARAITYSTVKNNLITKQIEFWPDYYEAPDWRKQWVTKII